MDSEFQVLQCVSNATRKIFIGNKFHMNAQRVSDSVHPLILLHGHHHYYDGHARFSAGIRSNWFASLRANWLS